MGKIIEPILTEKEEILWDLRNFYDEYNSISRYFYNKTNKARELFTKAFNPEYTTDEQYDALTRWYATFTSYRYTSLHAVEKDFYKSLAMIIDKNVPPVAKRWLSPKELEKEFGFSVSIQSKMRMASHPSTIPFSKVGNFIMYDRYRIDAWLEDHKVR